MRKIVSVIACLLVCVTISAQQPAKKIRYQGDVQLGYSIGAGEWAMDRVNLHLINSARFNDYVSLGFGLGLDVYTEFDEIDVAIPLFINVKGYLPVKNNIDLFASLDLGASVGVSEGMNGMAGLKLTPAIGVMFKGNQNPHHAFIISIGYDNQAWSQGGMSVNTNALSFKIGVSF
jgi:hypothetical protein